uniref:Uncharacterized protein n=1 Tax=Zea mays TaxID=4577 RepID=C4IYH4_MAIZE|nr:unknown [Zea mays]
MLQMSWSKAATSAAPPPAHRKSSSTKGNQPSSFSSSTPHVHHAAALSPASRSQSTALASASASPSLSPPTHTSGTVGAVSGPGDDAAEAAFAAAAAAAAAAARVVAAATRGPAAGFALAPDLGCLGCLSRRCGFRLAARSCGSSTLGCCALVLFMSGWRFSASGQS